MSKKQFATSKSKRHHFNWYKHDEETAKPSKVVTYKLNNKQQKEDKP